jgi:hypothetical protein
MFTSSDYLAQVEYRRRQLQEDLARRQRVKQAKRAQQARRKRNS